MDASGESEFRYFTRTGLRGQILSNFFKQFSRKMEQFPCVEYDTRFLFVRLMHDNLAAKYYYAGKHILYDFSACQLFLLLPNWMMDQIHSERDIIQKGDFRGVTEWHSVSGAEYYWKSIAHWCLSKDKESRNHIKGIGWLLINCSDHQTTSELHKPIIGS